MKREKTPAVAHESLPVVGAAIARFVVVETPKFSLSQSPALARCKHEFLKKALCKGLGCVPSHCEPISSTLRPAWSSAVVSEQSCTTMQRPRLCVNSKLMADHVCGVGIEYHPPSLKLASKVGSMLKLHDGALLQSKKHSSALRLSGHVNCQAFVILAVNERRDEHSCADVDFHCATLNMYRSARGGLRAP
jgi:hypothetical protein